MKEATGELNMTVVTIVAIAALVAFFYAIIWPNVKLSITNKQCESTCGVGNFTQATKKAINDGTFTCTCKKSVK